MDSFCKYFNRSKKKRKKGIKTSLFLGIFLIFKEKREDACTFPRFNFHPEDGRRKRVLGEGKLMYSVSGNTRKDPRRDCPKETKTPRSRGSREGVFVSLAKGMKNRESQPGFELTRTARAARFLTPPPPPVPLFLSTSFHPPPVSINRLPGRLGEQPEKSRPLFQ